MESVVTSGVLRSIVERALRPEEWAEFPGAVADRPGDQARVLLARWEERLNLFAGDPGAFRGRLRTLGLDRPGALLRLAPRRLQRIVLSFPCQRSDEVCVLCPS